MPSYLLAQVISLLVMVVGWLLMVGGVFIALVYVDKTKLIALLPARLSGTLSLLPEWLFYLPSAAIFVVGLLIVAFGHLVQTSIDNSRFTAETAQILELIRVRGL